MNAGIMEFANVVGAVGQALVPAFSELSPRCMAFWPCNEGAGETIADISGNGRHITKGSSTVTAATVWANPGRATFPGTAAGWSRSGTGIYGPFDNLAGGSLLMMLRINAASAPAGIDRMILGGVSVAGFQSTHIRLRPVGTSFNVGDDGTVGFGLYPSGGSVQVAQVTSPVPQAQRSVCTGRDRHVAILVDGAAKTLSIWYDGQLMFAIPQTASILASPLNTMQTFFIGTALAQAGNTESIKLFDIQLYASETAPPSDIGDSIARVAMAPYTFLTGDEWT